MSSRIFGISFSSECLEVEFKVISEVSWLAAAVELVAWPFGTADCAWPADDWEKIENSRIGGRSAGANENVAVDCGRLNCIWLTGVEWIECPE